jgi:hypothetical protein
MSLPTVPVTCVVADQYANPIEGATVTMVLNSPDVYEGFVVQSTVQDETDATGTVILNVFPNALGSMGTQYKVTIVTPEKPIRAMAVVPNGPCDLWNILNLDASPSISLAIQAQSAALESQQASAASAQQAALNQASAAMSALSAAQLAYNAATSEQNAQNAAALAASYGTSLGATSTTSATISTGSLILAVQANKQFMAGQWVIVVNAANPADWMAGPVTSYDDVSSLVVNVEAVGGSGTFANWNIGLSGVLGPQGVQGVQGSLAMMAGMALVMGGML